jgi:xylulokinase
MAAAAGFDMAKLPPLTRAWEPAGELRRELRQRWGIAGPVTVAGGAGDNLACKLGVGAARPGRGVLTIGTSGVICIATSGFRPIPGKGVQTPPHAAPDQFSSQGVVMSATSALEWLAALTGMDPATLDREAAALLETDAGGREIASAPLLVPYFDGVRTPHRNTGLRGAASGLSLSTSRAALAWALFEGVALAFAEVIGTQRDHGIVCGRLQLVGGGARSRVWPRMIASLFGVPLVLSKGREHAAAMGAARLARAALHGGSPLEILAEEPEVERIVEPEARLGAMLTERQAKYHQLRAFVVR